MITKETFEGVYFYQLENDLGEVIEKRVEWVLTIENNNGSFTGSRIDEESKEIFSKPIPVVGFKEGDEINFVVKYPYNYDIDMESGKAFPLKNEKHLGARYNGTYNHIFKKYEGKWEVDILEEKYGVFQTDTIVHSYGGAWEMKKKS